MAAESEAKPVSYAIAPQGAFYRPVHVERQVRIYPIEEHELKSLTMFSAIVTICSSIASGVLMFLLGVGWSVMTTSDPIVHKAAWMVAPLGGVVILATVVVGIWAHKSKGSSLTKILAESKARAVA